MRTPHVVAREQWQATRDELLVKEKQLIADDCGAGRGFGISVFLRGEAGAVYQTYFTTNRGGVPGALRLQHALPHPVWPPGGVGGPARGLAADLDV